MPHIEDVLLYSLAQSGKPYIFGAEAKASDPNPKAFDCSELVEWSCARAGVIPRVPDGAFYQWQHTRQNGRSLPVNEALRTRGALLFVGDGVGTGRDAITHVAWSLGDRTTIEARGRAWGVGTWPSADRFDFAGLIPGVDYSPGHGRLEPPQEEDDMLVILAPGAASLLHAGKLVHIETTAAIPKGVPQWDLNKEPGTWENVRKAFGNPIS